MKKYFSFVIGVTALLSVGVQFYLMIENRVSSIPETIIRFFSFFTILTNLLVGVFFTLFYMNQKKNTFSTLLKPESLTPVTVYITIVGLVYQFALRHVWEPKGLQKIIDELLHSIIPLLVIAFWCFYENKKAIQYKSILQWLIYPIVYLVYILVRGFFSNFYPYPFVDVANLGFQKVMFNSTILLLFFAFLASIFIKIGHKIAKYFF